jgi:hypothetical protein
MPLKRKYLHNLRSSRSNSESGKFVAAKRLKQATSDQSNNLVVQSPSFTPDSKATNTKTKMNQKRKRRLGLVAHKEFFFRFEFANLNQPNNRIVSKKFANSFEGLLNCDIF